MSEVDSAPLEPEGSEEAADVTAGEPRSSGSEALRDAMESPDPFRLSEERLNERDERFSGPRKEQGPPMEEPDSSDPGAMEDAADQIPETPPPDLPPTE